MDFNGGAFTCPLLILNTFGCRLFATAMILSLIDRCLAAIGGLVASLLCFPLYFFLVAPGIFRYLFPDAFWRHSQTNFYWDKWAIGGILLLGTTGLVCYLTLLAAWRKSQNKPGWFSAWTRQLTFQTLIQMVCCLASAIVSFKLALYFDDPESCGGALTGPFADFNDVGFFLLLFALILTSTNLQSASLCALMGSLLGLPLNIYVTSPRLISLIFPSIPFRYNPQPFFVWDSWALLGIFMLGCERLHLLSQLLIGEKANNKRYSPGLILQSP